MKPPVDKEKLASFIDKDFCGQKLDEVINLIRRLLVGDYPHKDSKHALKNILDSFKEQRRLLDSLDETAERDTILGFCLEVNINIVLYKPFIGLLLRSSNLRNAFEIYFPIKMLAAELLGEDTRVVLSSEWEFSPFTYPVAPQELSKFVFIGVPASECHNPLIIPLAAHELGHVVWRVQGAGLEFDTNILETILEIYRSRWDDEKPIWFYT
jgi:hypothetical protein